jgi:hypothetical protein
VSLPIIIDIDGCLAEFNGKMLELLNTIQGTTLGYPDGLEAPNCWHWFQPAGFTAKTEQQAWAFIKANPEWWYGLPAYPGAIEFICEVMEARDAGELTPYFVTSRPNQNVADVTNRWLCVHGASRPNVVVVQGACAKASVARAVGATAILDDHGPNFDGMPSTVQCYLLDRLWNQNDLTAPGLTLASRIPDLSTFLAAVRGPRILPSFAPAAA